MTARHFVRGYWRKGGKTLDSARAREGIGFYRPPWVGNGPEADRQALLDQAVRKVAKHSIWSPDGAKLALRETEQRVSEGYGASMLAQYFAAQVRSEFARLATQAGYSDHMR